MASPRRRAAPVVLLGAVAWLTVSLVARTAGRETFLQAPLSVARARRRTALRGFKEDFDAWRATLTPEERAVTLKQALNEYDRKYREAGELARDPPEEKVQSFAKILSKFFDAEAEDFKTEAGARTPDRDGLAKRADQKRMDLSLRNKIVEVDRNDDRRYNFATMRIAEAEGKGELFLKSSPLTEKWVLQNNDTESHAKNLELLMFVEKAAADPSCPPDAKPYMEEWVKKGIPPVGENVELPVPQVLVNQLHAMSSLVGDGLGEWGAADSYKKEKVPEIAARTIKHLTDKSASSRDDAEEEVDTMKRFFRSQKDLAHKTRADVLKEIWAELPKHTSKSLPPLDEEMLAELSELPVAAEGEPTHSWGAADVLYKSEAIDAFGLKYLLGVFETKAEAQKAFADWNEEYEKARVEMKAEMEQWGKREQARLERETTSEERIRKVLEETRR